MVTEVPGKIKQKTAKDEIRDKFKKPKTPSDFKTTDDFLKWAVKRFGECLEFDRTNREASIDDAKFVAGIQWDEHVKQLREANKKPTLIFNRLPAFVAQLIGNRRLNETTIKITPDDDGFKDTAKVREGLVRSIQKISKAQEAYNKAFENQVISGIGNFEVGLGYAYDDVFEQDIQIHAINNAFSVVWDTKSEMPTGEDASVVFIVDQMSDTAFREEWPNAQTGDPTTDTQLLGYDLPMHDWMNEKEVRVIRMWRMRSRKRMIALLNSAEAGNDSQDVVDITDMDPEDFQDRLVTDAAGMPIMREVDRKYAELYTFTALDILEGPYELPIKRVPVFRVPGWDLNVGETRVRFGLVRFLKDPQRLLNYWRSVLAEQLMMSPKGVWTATAEAVEGREAEWRDSHLSNDSLLIWDGESGQEPKRIPPAQLEPALIEQAGQASQDLRDISNLHEASLGQQSNEVSGKAILARQRVGETGTVVYQDNLDLAIEESGRVINDLIPFAYDTARVIKILGEEGEDLTPVAINGTVDDASIDITAGKYSVTSTTGPSFVTKRVEAAESMLNMINAMPQTMQVAADLVVDAMDWPGAGKIASRLRQMMAPGMVPERDMTDEQKAAMAAAQQQQQIEQQKQDAILSVEMDLKTAQTAKANAEAIEAQAKAAAAIGQVNIKEFEAVAGVASNDIKDVLAAMEKFETFTTPKLIE